MYRLTMTEFKFKGKGVKSLNSEHPILEIIESDDKEVEIMERFKAICDGLIKKNVYVCVMYERLIQGQMSKVKIKDFISK